MKSIKFFAFRPHQVPPQSHPNLRPQMSPQLLHNNQLNQQLGGQQLQQQQLPAAGSPPNKQQQPSTTSILRQQRMPIKSSLGSNKSSNFGLSKPAAPRRSSVEAAGNPMERGQVQGGQVQGGQVQGGQGLPKTPRQQVWSQTQFSFVACVSCEWV